MPEPRLSILVPNFNNGRESSRPGTRDFIDGLFRSLARTLEHDPTPLEIIVADDGSSDDSLATCRRWARCTWRGGAPFCRLIELDHCGVLSTVANRLPAEARGELCCRLDGDVVVLTRNWGRTGESTRPVTGCCTLADTIIWARPPSAPPWNVSVFGPAVEWPPATGSPAALGNSEWVRFTEDPAYRAAVLWRVALVDKVTRRLGRRRVGLLYSRGGLLCHLLARDGLSCVGVDPDASLVRLAESVAAREDHPRDPPAFASKRQRSRLPLDDNALSALLLVDVLDRHPNPVGLYREAHRTLEPDGILLAVTAHRSSPLEGDHPACRGYRPHELRMQLSASGCFEPLPLTIDASSRGLLVVAARALATRGSFKGDGVLDDVAEQVAGRPGRVACDAPAGLVE